LIKSAKKSVLLIDNYVNERVILMLASPQFKVYLVKEFQRLKTKENNRLQLEWNL